MDLGLLGKTAVVIARGLAETTTGTGVTVDSVLVGRRPRKVSRNSSMAWRSNRACPRPS